MAAGRTISAAVLLVVAPSFYHNAWADPSSPSFQRDVFPILNAYCWKCHGGEAREAELDLRSLPLMLQGGKNGAAIVRGSAADSLLYEKLSKRQMPPDGELKPTDVHIATIRAWLDAGAPADYESAELDSNQAPPLTADDRDWWAFKKPVRPAIPDPGVPMHGKGAWNGAERIRTPIDAFLLRRLQAEGLEFSADAPPATLLRRVFLDVIGLPPGPDEVEAFLTDASPDAYEKLVNRLLASRHYGERWGRHWLDAAGYVDTIGSDNDATIIEPREGIWRYRDYVVGSLNEDKPYDRFLLEQLAGDELVDWRGAKKFTPEIKGLLVATGFLRQAADVTYAPELNTADIRTQVLHDTVRIVTSNLLGLTVHCAQCHTHKFDPISQLDYFRLAAVFQPAYDPQRWKHSKDRFLYDVATMEKQQIDGRNEEIDGQIGQLNQDIDKLRRPFAVQLAQARLAKVPDSVRDAVGKATATAVEGRNEVQVYLVEKLAPLLEMSPPENSVAALYSDTKTAQGTADDKRNAVQKYLAETVAPWIIAPAAEIDKALDDTAQQRQRDLEQRIVGLQSEKRSYGTIQALWDVGPPRPAYLDRRGDYQTPGAVVRPGGIAVLGNPESPLDMPDPDAEAPTSGYRTVLARWLTRRDHPLTGRVIVNRVWQHYFGRGIVATPDNFGSSGAAPTHPELLDWLAVDFVEGGWTFKRLHRQILLSTAYRQASYRPAAGQDSATADAARSLDPDNRLLWRQRLRRLESESVRDQVLAVSGTLDRTAGGPPVPLKPNADGSVEIDTSKLATPTDRFRRSLYLFARRNYQLTELNVFDQPLLSHNCTRRTHSAVVLQSLAMLNGKFIFEQSEQFAARVRRLAGTEEDKRIETAFRLALVRAPGDEERTLSAELLRSQAARYRGQGDHDPQQAADAALVDLCHMLLNTNEFLYVH